MPVETSGCAHWWGKRGSSRAGHGVRRRSQLGPFPSISVFLGQCRLLGEAIVGRKRWEQNFRRVCVLGVVAQRTRRRLRAAFAISKRAVANSRCELRLPTPPAGHIQSYAATRSHPLGYQGVKAGRGGTLLVTTLVVVPAAVSSLRPAVGIRPIDALSEPNMLLLNRGFRVHVT